MGFVDAVKAFFSNYVKFDGRSSRSEFWWVMLFFVIMQFVIMALTAMSASLGNIVSLVFGLGTLVPSIALGIRRFHDVEKVGWWVIALLIPLVNIIVALIFLTKRGTIGSNQYGPDPLGGTDVFT